MCQGALTRKRTLWGGGALELGDLRLLEDGSERGSALGSDTVASETARQGRMGNGERIGVSMGIDTNANIQAAAHPRLMICVSLRMAASAVAPSAPMSLAPRLCARGRVGNGERVGVSMGADKTMNTLGVAAH